MKFIVKHIAEAIAIGVALFVLVLIIANKVVAVPIACFSAALWSLYRAIKSSRSNSTTQVGLGSSNVRTLDNTGNVPWYKTPQFIFACIFTAAGIISVFMLIADK